ncbi:MAG: TonB-dependent receptor [Bryobacterales bacterium]|nr:TonB-dependent receptor [Bryobacterales bacterium]
MKPATAIATRLLALSLLFGASAFAQGNFAQITGLITDASGAAVPQAKIEVVQELTGTRRTAVSNELGYFNFVQLPPAEYRLRVEHQGFRTATRTGVSLAVGQTATIDFALQVGQVAETVEVAGDASQVDTQTATIGAVVDQRRIRELPLNGRDATQLIGLLPGIVGTTDTSGLRQGGSGRGIVQPGFSSNGARSNMINYSLDGAFHNDTYTNVALAMPNPDALQEFRVQTNNFSAEFGRGAGAVVNAVTRSGTNQLHGSLFEFHRNNALNARNFFASTDDGLKRHQFGGTIGGPVYIPKIYDGRNKTFFFFSHQEGRQRQRPSDLSTVVPTAAQRAGDFSAFSGTIIDPLTRQPFPNKQIPLSRLNPVTRNIFEQILPLPTEPNTGVLWYSVPNNVDERQSVIKIDHQLSERDTFTARYFYNYFHSLPNDSPLVFASRPDRFTPSHNISAGHTHLFSPTLLNQLTFAFNHRSDIGNPVWRTSVKDLGIRNINTFPEYPAFVMSVAGAFSVETTEQIVTTPRAFTLNDVVRWTRGRHQISTGFEYRRQTLYKSYNWLLDGNYRFAGDITGYGVADFFLGRLSSITQNAFAQTGEMSMHSYAAFVHDTIRVTPRFTLNFGLRYEPFLPYTDKADRVTAFRPGAQSTVFTNAPPGLLYPGDPGVPRGGTQSDLNNLAPRFGFAWAPFGGTRTSVRGGYGIFYDASPMSAIANVFQTVAPFGTSVTVAPPPGPFEDPYLGNSPFPMPFPPPRDVAFPQFIGAATYPERLRTAYLQDWHLTFEHELVSNWTMRLAYAGSKGTGLLQGLERNAAIVGPGATRANVSARRPYAPYFQGIRELSASANSSFNSLQATVDKRFSRGFTLLANYTFAKSIDTGSGAGTLWPSYSNPQNFRADRGLSDFHRAHRFVLSGLWQIPGTPANAVFRTLVAGWGLGGVFQMQSGQPFSALAGQDNALTGVNLDYADLVGDPSRSARAVPTRDPVLEWFNTRAFAHAPQGTYGNAGRNILRGDDLASIDASLTKDFRIREQTAIQFRAEAFNLTNRTNFNLPANRITQATFGRITSAQDPRILQFALKLRF